MKRLSGLIKIFLAATLVILPAFLAFRATGLKKEIRRKTEIQNEINPLMNRCAVALNQALAANHKNEIEPALRELRRAANELYALDPRAAALAKKTSDIHKEVTDDGKPWSKPNELAAFVRAELWKLTGNIQTGGTGGAIRFFDLLSWVLPLLGAVSASALYAFPRAEGKKLRDRIVLLKRGTKALREGDLSYRFQDIGGDAAGEIMYDFNRMARRLENQDRTLREANEKLQHQAAELLEAHRHKDRFLSNMSHELRTPLNSIIGFAELMEAKAERLSPEKIRNHTKKIIGAAEHLLSLIVALLDVARTDAGVLKPVMEPFQLSECAASAVEMLKPLAKKKGLFLSAELPEQAPVRADRRMILQIFVNLLGNAVKFTETGCILLSIHNTDRDYVCDVKDTGIGIPEEELGKIFRDFHRVENEKTVTEGTGIGLTLSRRLAALHHGSIEVKSKAGEGSTFTLRLPKGS